MKKYLVVKMAEGWSHVVNWVVMPGLYTMEAAQQFVASAVADEPGAQVHDSGSGSGVRSNSPDSELSRLALSRDWLGAKVLIELNDCAR